MPLFPHCRRCRLLLVFALILCLLLPAEAMAVHLKDDLHTGLENEPFFVLILGDSQMAGAGWEGGYANCISETYRKAQVLNLAQNGSLLANGDIQKQWDFFVEEGFDMPDFVLLDGGLNDLASIKKENYKDSSLAAIKESLCSLIEQIHETSPDTRIIYTLIPPLVEWSDSEKGPPSYDIQERYWKIMNITVNDYSYVTVLDLFSLNPFHYPCTDCYHKNFADSLHLSEAGYRNTFEYFDNIFLVHLTK